VNKKSEYKPTRLFYNLRQLLCYCEANGPLASSPSIAESPEFYTALQTRLEGFIRDGHKYIAKDAHIQMSPLHCINTHKYEFIDGDLAEQLQAQNIQIYKSSIEAIAGEYCASGIADNASNYLKQRIDLAESLDEPNIKKIIQNDIHLTQAFQNQVSHLIEDNMITILVNFRPNQSHDSSLINQVSATAQKKSLTKQTKLDFSIT
jgi:hypothetical protein